MLFPPPMVGVALLVACLLACLDFGHWTCRLSVPCCVFPVPARRRRRDLFPNPTLANSDFELETMGHADVKVVRRTPPVQSRHAESNPIQSSLVLLPNANGTGLQGTKQPSTKPNPPSPRKRPNQLTSMEMICYPMSAKESKGRFVLRLPLVHVLVLVAGLPLMLRPLPFCFPKMQCRNTAGIE
jgi:hypothetical protein